MAFPDAAVGFRLFHHKKNFGMDYSATQKSVYPFPPYYIIIQNKFQVIKVYVAY